MYVNLDSYQLNGEFELTASEVRRDEFYYDCCRDERYSNLQFSMLVLHNAEMSPKWLYSDVLVLLILCQFMEPSITLHARTCSVKNSQNSPKRPHL